MPAFRRSTVLALAAGLALAAPAAADETKFEATLAGHAILPAFTFFASPADAPRLFATSGKFAGPGNRRIDALYAVTGTSFLSDKTAPRETGLDLPFVGQPVQGFSGIKSLGDGEYLVLVDNGFGSKANSADVMLAFHRIRPDWETGKVKILDTVTLADPDRVLPFPIVTEGTETRYLTGADFDIESIQPIGDGYWIGDEFGPYLIEVDGEGRVLGLHDTVVDGAVVKSPDNPSLSLPSTPGATPFRVRRSRGFEGMAASPDGRFLYPLLEGPLWDEQAKAWESADGKAFLRILEFDVAKRAYTGRSWKLALSDPGNNIGDFNMIDAERGMIIERDNGEGDPDRACGGQPQADCFNVPAKLKHIVLIDMSRADAAGFVKRIGYVDLMDIRDPDGKARLGGSGGTFTFPFVTIEDVDVVDGEHIIVGNDNNLPFSSGRAIGANDHNELILLRVPEMLSAK